MLLCANRRIFRVMRRLRLAPHGPVTGFVRYPSVKVSQDLTGSLRGALWI
jgi:hypothetical protein